MDNFRFRVPLTLSVNGPLPVFVIRQDARVAVRQGVGREVGGATRSGEASGQRVVLVLERLFTPNLVVKVRHEMIGRDHVTVPFSLKIGNLMLYLNHRNDIRHVSRKYFSPIV